MKQWCGLKKFYQTIWILLHKLSIQLLEREILDAEEIDTLIRGEELPPVKKNGSIEADIHGKCLIM